jgi:hypothetical protein
MFSLSPKTFGALLLTTLLVVAACGNSPASPAASPTGPVTTPAGSATGSDLSGAVGAFSSVTSYKFTMTLTGGTFGSSLSALGGAVATGNTPFTVSGTVVEGANPAADIKMGDIETIEIGGFQYMSMGTGAFVKTPSGGTSLAASFSPAQMFTNMVDASTYSGYTKIGAETKNGVMSDHYQANQTVLSQYGSMAGVTSGATWSAEVWTAQNGGYPVSMNITAKAPDNSVAYQVLFDVTNVNDPANTVTVPSNVVQLTG